MIKLKKSSKDGGILMSSIEQVISHLKEKKIYVNKVLSRTELMKRLTESIQNGNKNNNMDAISNESGNS